MGRTGKRALMGLVAVVALLTAFAVGILSSSASKSSPNRAPAVAAAARPNVVTHTTTKATTNHTSAKPQSGQVRQVPEYPPGFPATLAVSVTDPCVGGSEVITGTFWKPGETVDITINGTLLASPVANGAGDINVTVGLGSRQPGPYTITATGQTSNETASVNITIIKCSSGNGNGGGLAMTGSDVVAALVLAAVLLVGGVGIQLAAQRRRSRNEV